MPPLYVMCRCLLMVGYLLVMAFLLLLMVLLLYWSKGHSVISLVLSEVELFNLDFMSSPSSSLFLFLVLVVSIIIVLYSSYYMGEEFSMSYYMMMMLLFMLSMVALLFHGNWVVAILSWEGLGISSFFLINYYQAWESYNNALTTLMNMRMGDYFFFIMFLAFIMNMGLSVSMEVNPLEVVWLVLLSFTKSAQLPFSGWLPKAMSAPTPTSALVHSSTLVTAGLVLLMTYSEVVCSEFFLTLMVVAGFSTMVVGSVTAVSESSVKKLVAYSTLSQMGLGMMTYGLGQFYVGYMNLVAHGLAKSLLFIQVGYLIHCGFNQQDSRKWSAVGQVEGLMRIQVLSSLASLCGVAFYSGMLSKEMILELMNSSSWYVVLLLGMMFSVYLTLLYSFVIYKSLFNSAPQPVGVNHTSTSLLVCTLLEVCLVASFFSWLGANLINVPSFYSYVEVWVPLMVLIAVVVVYLYLIDISVYPNVMKITYVFGNGQHYKWVQILLVNFKWLESFMYYCNMVFSTVIYMISMKALSLNVGMSNHMLTFLVVVMMLLL